jgi:hypothetical protein
MRSPARFLALLAASAAMLAGCAPAPGPQSSPPPPSPSATESHAIVSGAPDTAGSVPTSKDAKYIYRFKQSSPGSAAFNFRDRDVSFYFRPGPSALYFKVENLQGRPVWIDWDHSNFIDPNGRSGKVAHGTTRWQNRLSPPAMTQVPGQQQYGDYVFPMDYLVDPGAVTSDEAQPHLPLLPDDTSAPSYSGREFGVDLVFMIEDKPRTYSFRYQVVSVIPR